MRFKYRSIHELVKQAGLPRAALTIENHHDIVGGTRQILFEKLQVILAPIKHVCIMHRSSRSIGIFDRLEF